MKEFLELRRAFVIAVFIGIFALAARNVLDPDVWWHLKTGEWIVQHRAVPHADPFSYTRAGQPWIAHEWLFELAIYGIFRASGFAGLIISFAAIISTAFVPIYLRCRADPVISGAVATWGALATAVVWGVRPQILSLLVLSSWLLLLERSEKDPRLLWWALPLTVLWVNLHAGFILGPVFVALFIAGEWIETRFSTASKIHHRLGWLSLTLLASLALAVLNPNGASIFRYTFETLRSIPMQAHITEWGSPNFHGGDYRAFFFLLLAAFAALALSPVRVRSRDLLLLLVGIAAALSSVRMIPLFVLVAVPPVARAVSHWLSRAKVAAVAVSARSWLASTGVLFLLIAFAATNTSRVIQHQQRAEAAVFPSSAVAYLQEHPPAGPIFNYYSWGGYLIFKLYPRIPVFIDGRADLYGDDVTRFVNTYYLQKNWEGELSQWNVTTVIAQPDCPLASALRELPEWSLSYQDSVAAVFSKSLPANSLQDGFSRSASLFLSRRRPSPLSNRPY